MAATENLTSLGVKLNGKTFYELYQEDKAVNSYNEAEYRIGYNHGANHFYFCIPKSAFVATEEYPVPVLTIDEGTPFMNSYLPAIELHGNLETEKWEIYEEINYDLSFVEIIQNNLWFAISYDTEGFHVGDTGYGRQSHPDNVSGIYFNGEEINRSACILWGVDRFVFNIRDKYDLTNMNGYSHATLEIRQGASFTAPDNDKPFTVKESLTFYWVNESWTTEKPADYVAPAPSATFVSVGDTAETNNKNTVTLNYSVGGAWTEDSGNLADKLLLDDSTLSSINGTITRNNNSLVISWTGDYSALTISADAEFNGMKIPELNLYYTNGYWLTSKLSAPTATYTGFADGWNNRLNDENTFYYNTLRYEQILDGGADKADGTNLAASLNSTSLNVKFNGKTFYELYKENSSFEVSYRQGHKYVTIIIPKDYMNADKLNGYEYPTITIAGGTPFMNYYLPELELILYEGQWLDASKFNPEPIEFTGIPQDWNNRVEGSTNRCLIMSFGQWGTDYLGSAASSTNLANPDNGAPIANNLTLNGKTFAELYAIDSNVNVNYAHGYNYLYIIVPEYMLQNVDFGAVTLKLNKTIFLNSVLDEVTLYLVNEKWTTVKPAVIEQEDESYVTIKDLFDDNTQTFDGESTLQSEKTAKNEAIYKFLLKNDSKDCTFVFTVNEIVAVAFTGSDKDKLVTLYVNGKEEGSGSYSYSDDEWFSIRIAVKNAESLSVSVAVDNYILIDESDIDNTGFATTGVLFSNESGKSVIADYKSGDIKAPILVWNGKGEYRYEVGDSKPEDSKFLNVLDISDNKDINISDDSVVITWQEGGLTQDDKLNVGEWIVTISVSDTAGNVATHKVKVMVVDSTLVKVEIDGQETSETYRLGDHIAAPETTPTKDSTKEYDYAFDGWYFGDKKWDFANDVVEGDTQLVAKFIATARTYTVKITSEGLEENYEYTLKLAYGAEISNNLLAREGYTFTIVLDNKQTEFVIVSKDSEYRVVYAEKSTTPSGGDSGNDNNGSNNKPADDNKGIGCGGCGSSVSAVSASVFSGLSVITLAGVMLLRKKKEKIKNDENV